ncbi:MAG: glycosyltransferase [Candidatus Saccharibacteria bacterium]|nr:glycosyltransferase [Candidatus Saccharibacteria bacterium]
MKTPLVSIIIPVHNAERYIDRCIESILEQDYKNYEIIAVVDNSQDASLAILNKYASENMKLKIIESSAGSPGGARNNGLKSASGDLIMFVDADDALYSGAISRLFDVMESTESEIVVGAYSGDEVVEQPKKSITVYGFEKARIKMLYQEISAAPWAKLYRAETIGKMRFPDYMMAEDKLFNYLVFSKAKQIAVDNQYCYRYIQNESGLVLKPFSVERMDGLKAIADMEKIATENNESEEIMEAIKCCYFFDAFSDLYTIKNTKSGKKKFGKEYKYLSGVVKQNAQAVIDSKYASKRQKRFAKNMKRSISGTLSAMKIVGKIRS